jgi:8-oxo-dGTP pyrophosphatase MutT (NUDIX family)
MAPWYTLKREAARVVLLDDADRIFLMRASDPADHAKGEWWEIPGGGIDKPETSAEGAARELYEETGMRAEIGPCIWRQHAVFEFGGIHFDQQEYVHVARWTSGGYAPTHLEALEALAFTEGRWWTFDELCASDAPTLPRRLRELLPPVLAGDLPDPPLDITEPGTDGR